MNGTPNESMNAGLGANGEDLNVVLGRFQTWAASRTKAHSATPSAKARPQKGAVPGGAKLAGDAREISYDQALRASRYRRPESAPAPDPLSRSAAKPAKAPDKGETTLTDKNSSYTTAHWNEAEDPDIEPWEHRWPEVRFTKKTSTLATGGETRAEKAASPPVAQAAQAASRKAVSLTGEPGSVAKKAAGIKRTVQGASAVQSPRSVPVASAAPRAEPPSPAVAARRHRPQPVFREVLKGTAALAAASTGSTSLASGKSTTLTLRVSDGEQARIQACAAQANLSVSAYLRQCALGVDELRGQVEMALANVRKEQEKPVEPPGLAAIPGILRRFGRKCLQRFTAAGTNTPPSRFDKQIRPSQENPEQSRNGLLDRRCL